MQSTHDIAARSGKVKLGDFTDWLTVKLAKAGHRAMCHYVATIEAFPLPIDKEELSWTCLVKAAEGNDEMIANLEVLEKNPLLQGHLIDYVSDLLLMNICHSWLVRYGVVVPS